MMRGDNGRVLKPTFFAGAEAFRRWLERHGARASELLVGFRTVRSAKPSMTWSQSVDEALCFGWIDGVRRNFDAESYTIRFTPRRPQSNWSAINIAKVESLKAEGRMRPAGLAAFKRRTEARSRTYTYEQRHTLELAPADIRTFRKNKAAWRYFEQVPPSYRKLVIFWVVGAKKPETREDRLKRLIEACAAGVRL